MDEDYPRTKTDVTLDIRYYMRLHELHARLLRRFRLWAVCTILIAGAAAVTDLTQHIPHGVMLAGLVITFLTVIDSQCRWEERAVKHSVIRARYGELLSELAPMEFDAAERALVLITIDSDDEFEGLRLVAYNDAMRSNGLDTRVRPETFNNRVMRLLV